MDWFSSLSSLSSSLWGDEPESREMNTYSYEYELISEIVSNEIKLKSERQEKKGVTTYLYFGLDEGKPYIKLVYHYNDINNNKVVTEEKFMITSCYAESGRGAWFVEYTCKNGIVFHFIRMYRVIETTIKKNGLVVKYYTIDVKREPRFKLFNEKDVKSEMWDDLRDLYEFEGLFEHPY